MRLLLPFWALLALSCEHRDGLVGVQPLGVEGTAGSAGTAGRAGAGAAGSTGAAGAAGAPPVLGFYDDFVQNAGSWDELPRLPGASTTVGVADDQARDGYVAELRFPGNPGFGAEDQAGSQFSTELASNERFHFGTFRTRLGFGSCDPTEETVMSFLGYFGDGQDRDDDGIVDELVLSFQVLCGTPSRLYLTVFTDYQETPELSFRKLSRMLDFESGDFADTPSAGSDAYGATRRDAAFELPNLFTPGELYELGFEWHADSLRFFLMQDGSERALWSVTGAERIPQQPLHIVYHAWHTPTHWYPSDGAADYPASDVVMRVDWVSYEPE